MERYLFYMWAHQWRTRISYCWHLQSAEPSHQLHAAHLWAASHASRVRSSTGESYSKAGSSEALQTRLKKNLAKHSWEVPARGSKQSLCAHRLWSCWNSQVSIIWGGWQQPNRPRAMKSINASILLQSKVSSVWREMVRSQSTEQVQTPNPSTIWYPNGKQPFFSVFKEKTSPAVNAAQIS